MPNERYVGGWACDVCDRYGLCLFLFFLILTFVNLYDAVICNFFARSLSFIVKFASLMSVVSARYSLLLQNPFEFIDTLCRPSTLQSKH